MTTHLLLRGGTVVDGSGTSARRGDVFIGGSRIVSVGDDLDTGDAEVIDVGGLVVAPGFVDPHTHYDAQVTWDRDLTPSCWHGVTTVVMGHCGYSLAPTRPQDREFMVRTLEAVEGMSREALEAGIGWTFETFGEYLDAVAAVPNRLNVGALVGHSALRLFVMGEAASERTARPDEVAEMARVMAEAMDDGALGFSTSRAAVDLGAFGRPVPSRLADLDELHAVVAAMGQRGRGVTQILPGTVGDSDATVALMASIVEASGRPVTFGAVLSGLWGPRGAGMALIDRCAEFGPGLVVPQVACRPIVQQTSFGDPFFLTMFSPAFEEALAVPIGERAGVYRAAGWRDRLRATVRRPERLAQAVVAESSTHPDLVRGPSLGEVAASLGCPVSDLMVDLALDDELGTRFEIALANDDEDEVGDYLRDDRTLVSLSDAGAHQSQICDAVYPTHLLGHWVRELGALPLETAVWHLTKRPADVFGLEGRGQVRPGFAADLVVFDPATVAAGPLERVHDLPAHADRLIAASTGIEHVLVNGVPIRRDGTDVDASWPGQVLRGGR